MYVRAEPNPITPKMMEIARNPTDPWLIELMKKNRAL